MHERPEKNVWSPMGGGQGVEVCGGGYCERLSSATIEQNRKSLFVIVPGYNKIVTAAHIGFIFYSAMIHPSSFYDYV